MSVTTITGVVTDSDAVNWVLASWVAALILPAGSGKAVFKAGGNVPLAVSGRLDSTGAFTGNLPDTSSMLPSGCMWRLSIASLTSASASVIPARSITGGSFNLGSFASNYVVAPRIQSAALVYAYDPIEVINPINGDGFIDTATSTSFFWNGSAWIALAGGGSGTVQAGTHTILPFYTANGDIVGPSQITSDNTGVNLNVPNIVSTAQMNATRTVGYPGGLANSFQNAYTQFNGSASAFHGGGFSLGNLGGWTTNSVMLNEIFGGTRGITQGIASRTDKQSVGDSAGIYTYSYSDGGATAPSDEGQTAATFQSHEYNTFFQGTISATTGLGDTAPVLAQTSGSSWVSDGAMLLNITKGTIFGNFNGGHTVVQNFIQALPVSGVVLPLTTSWAFLNAPISPPISSANFNSPVTVGVTLQQIGGVQSPDFQIGDTITVAGQNFCEQVLITGAAPSVASVQNITFSCHYPQLTAYFFKGGVQGQYISFDADLALNGFPTSFYALGSLTGTDLLYGFYVTGICNAASLPDTGNFAATQSGTGSGFHLYPGAEIVANTDGHHALTLEHNRVNWQVNDVVWNPHNVAQAGTALMVVKEQFSSTNSSSGLTGILLSMEGAGWAGGNVTAHRTINSNPKSFYFPTAGKTKVAPVFHDIEGAYAKMFVCDFSPVGDAGGATLFQFNNVATSLVNIFEGPGWGTFFSDPATGKYTIADLISTNIHATNFSAGTAVDFTTALVTFPASQNFNVIVATGNADFQANLQANTIDVVSTANFLSNINVTQISGSNNWDTTGRIQCPIFASGGTDGITGSFTMAVGTVITVKGGIITSIV